MTTLWGKDISAHQGGPAVGPDFCWIKQSEGTYNSDRGAGRTRAGVPWVGAYHYGRPGRSSPEAEAKWIVDHFPKDRDGICLDIEAGMGEMPYPIPLLTGQAIDNHFARVAQLVHDALGLPVVVYCARSYGYILRKTLALPFVRLWLATLNPHFGSTWNGNVVWFNQYVWTPIDGDLFNGDATDLARYIGGAQIPAGPGTSAPTPVLTPVLTPAVDTPVVPPPTPAVSTVPQCPPVPGVTLGTLSLAQWNAMVARGDRNSHTAAVLIQHVLNMFGDGPVTEDGVIGPNTLAALAHFQVQTGLPSQTRSILTIPQWVVASTHSNRFHGSR